MIVPNWFIALPIPADAWHETLNPPEGVRLFGAGDLHITVAFLGPASEVQACAAFEHAPTFPLPALEVSLANVVALGGARRPSAFAALLGEGRERVERAISEVRERMWLTAGARVDTRPALAHVTFARPERRASQDTAKAARRWALGLELGAPRCRIDRIALYTWSAERRAQLFQIVREFTLPPA
jgi:2'-5' RNA ligase